MHGIHTQFFSAFAQEVDGGGTEGMLQNQTCKRKTSLSDDDDYDFINVSRGEHHCLIA
jgi:hypothetical protein